MLRQAEYHHRIDLAALRADARSRNLRRVLDLYVPGQGRTDSELEADFYELVARRTPLPRPELQHRTPGGRADFVWEDRRLIAEVDGYDAHRGRVAFREDRARDRENARRGYETLRFTWEDVQLTPEAVAEDLTSAESRRSRLSSTKP
jgi:very-short-patch-repair endonuclease